MKLFWDTSAFLSLIFIEPSSDRIAEAWNQSELDVAWRWLEVEARAGATRRRATPSQWALLEECLAQVRFVEIEKEALPRLCEQNRQWGLRSADAGHVFVFKELAACMPGLEMVCLDREMRTIVRRLDLPLLGDRPGKGSSLREKRAGYRTGRKRKQP